MEFSLLNRLARHSIKFGEKILKIVLGKYYLRFVIALINQIDLIYSVPVRTGEIRFKCVSETTRIRAREMLRREPDTLEWIDSFNDSEILWDIGANIGVFSLYAAIVSGTKVWAFDPLPQNYMNLVENLTINGLNHMITPLCVAISDKGSMDCLHIGQDSFTSGGAGCTFGINEDNYGKPIKTFVEHTTIGYSVDELISQFNLPVPNHLKVDIDGIQESVVLGAKSTLQDPRLRSVMIELQPNNIKPAKESNDIIISELEAAGFSCLNVVGSTPNLTPDREVSTTNNFFFRK